MYRSIMYVSSEVYLEANLLHWKGTIILVVRSLFIIGSFHSGAAVVVCEIYSLHSTFMFSFYEKAQKVKFNLL